MHIAVLTSVAAFHELRAEWLQLLAQVPGASVFLTPEWQETWWRHFGAGHELHVLTVRAENGTLQGLAPLMIGEGTSAPVCLEFIGNLELCDYFDILMAPAQQPAIGRALLEHLVAQTGDAVELCFRNLPQVSPTLTLLRDGLAMHGLVVEVEEIETCPTIALPDSWEDYLALLRGKDRHELRRKMRRAEAAAQLAYRVTTRAEELEQDLDTFITLHRMSPEHAKQGFMTEAKAAFFRDMVRRLWAQGWLELVFLHADERPIAALCCFTYGTTYAAYNSAYHPGYADLSAGIVLFAHCIQRAIARRCVTFDFLRGNEPYKYRFGATDQPLYQLLARAVCSVQGSCL